MKKVSSKPPSKPFILGNRVESVQIRCFKYRDTSPEKTVRELVTSPQREEIPHYYL